jgi:hypothetical protein
MPKAKGSKKSTSSSIFGHDSALRVIGFIADMTAIVTVLLAIKTDTVLRALPLILSPWFLFPVWILAAYTYLCWLHAYWVRTAEEDKWSNRFSVFVISDLLIRLRNPILGFPVLLLGITLIWIARSTGTLLPLVVIFSGLCTLGLIFAPIWWELLKTFLRPNDRESKNALVEQRWQEFITLVDKKLEARQWLDTDSFKEISIVWGFDENTLLFAFAKYAALYPEKAYLGRVVDRQSFRTVVDEALINVQNLNSGKFFYK